MTGSRTLDAALVMFSLGAVPSLLMAALATVCRRRGVTE